uniref:(California timema) hypothetical protein n=1 Tax=Timema californicum TaxID=61474 RepID=A0A7R9P6D9_TIMCA|nr:unnamed protein product [Timema californicum]
MMYSSPVASLVLSDSSQLTSDSQHLEKIVIFVEDEWEPFGGNNLSNPDRDLNIGLFSSTVQYLHHLITGERFFIRIVAQDPQFIASKHAIVAGRHTSGLHHQYSYEEPKVNHGWVKSCHTAHDYNELLFRGNIDCLISMLLNLTSLPKISLKSHIHFIFGHRANSPRTYVALSWGTVEHVSERDVETLDAHSGRQSQLPRRNWPHNKLWKPVQSLITDARRAEGILGNYLGENISQRVAEIR